LRQRQPALLMRRDIGSAQRVHVVQLNCEGLQKLRRVHVPTPTFVPISSAALSIGESLPLTGGRVVIGDASKWIIR
jgi:hypothetical protein